MLLGSLDTLRMVFDEIQDGRKSGYFGPFLTDFARFSRGLTLKRHNNNKFQRQVVEHDDYRHAGFKTSVANLYFDFKMTANANQYSSAKCFIW